jgi:hypothetical protein
VARFAYSSFARSQRNETGFTRGNRGGVDLQGLLVARIDRYFHSIYIGPIPTPNIVSRNTQASSLQRSVKLSIQVTYLALVRRFGWK